MIAIDLTNMSSPPRGQGSRSRGPVEREVVIEWLNFQGHLPRFLVGGQALWGRLPASILQGDRDPDKSAGLGENGFAHVWCYNR